MLAYLAGPIDMADGAVAKEVRLAAREELETAGFAVYDPSQPWTGPRQDADAVVAVNEFALDRADAVLALVPTGVPSIGTPMEISRAWEAGKPIATLGGAASIQLQGMGNIEVFGWEDVREAALFLSARADDAESRRWDELRFVGDEEFTPTRAYSGDAGLDLYCSESVVIYPGNFVDVPCGIRVELPPGVWARVTGRSSTLREKRLLVAEGVIDNGWRGPIFAGVQNLGERKATVERGERVAQLIPFPILPLRPKRVGELSASERGERGFGSSGR